MTKRRVLSIIITILVSLLLPMSVFADDGATIFKAKCASCHGANGSGDTSMGKAMKLRDLGSPEVQKQTDKELFSITSDGKGKMPAYKAKLSEADINALVAFMRGLAKK